MRHLAPHPLMAEYSDLGLMDWRVVAITERLPFLCLSRANAKTRTGTPEP
jgi:hypothetical protein